MPMNQALLGEFEHEMIGTRKTLERIPENKFDWAPHSKSTKLGKLSKHLAEIPGWVKETLTKDSLDLMPGGKQNVPVEVHTRKEVMEIFEKNVVVARGLLGSVTDEELFKPWSLLQNGKVLMTMPKIAVLRSFVFNHNVHHRAQLGVYLRLNDVAVPSIYGPSADENPF